MKRKLRCFVILGESSASVIEILPDWRGRWQLGRAISDDIVGDVAPDALEHLIRRATTLWELTEVVEVVWCLPPDILGVAFQGDPSGGPSHLSLPYPPQQVVVRSVLQSDLGSVWLWMHQNWLDVFNKVGAVLGVQQTHILTRASFLDAFTRHRWLDGRESQEHSLETSSGPVALADGAYTHLFLAPGHLVRSWVNDAPITDSDRQMRTDLEVNSVWGTNKTYPSRLHVSAVNEKGGLDLDVQRLMSPPDVYRVRLVGPPIEKNLQRRLYGWSILGSAASAALIGFGYLQHKQWIEETTVLRAELKPVLAEANRVQSLKTELQIAEDAVRAGQRANIQGVSPLGTLARIIAALPRHWTIHEVRETNGDIKIVVTARAVAQLPPVFTPETKPGVDWMREANPISSNDGQQYQATYVVPTASVQRQP